MYLPNHTISNFIAVTVWPQFLSISPRKVILNSQQLPHSDAWMAFITFCQKLWRGCHCDIIFSLKEQVWRACQLEYNTPALYRTSALVKLFKSHLKELLGASAPTPPTTASKMTRVSLKSSSFLQFNIRNQKANYLHNLKYSMIHVYLTLGISLRWQLVFWTLPAVPSRGMNTDYLRQMKIRCSTFKGLFSRSKEWKF